MHPIAIADLNNDGLGDLIIACAYNDQVRIALANPAGGFHPAYGIAVNDGPASIRAQDFDGNGLVDLVISNFNSGDVTYLQSAGGGLFEPPVSIPVNGTGSGTAALWGMNIADLNGDGRLDLAVLDDGQDRLVTLFQEEGDGNFRSPP